MLLNPPFNLITFFFQSRVGPVQWLKPYTDEVLVELGQKGVKNLLAVPVRYVVNILFLNLGSKFDVILSFQENF